MSESPTPDEIRAEIQRTRSELGDTVDALTNKLDVKAQAKQKVDSVRSTISDKAAQARQSAPAPVQKALDRTGEVTTPALQKAAPYTKQIALGVGGLLAVWLFWRGRRSS